MFITTVMCILYQLRISQQKMNNQQKISNIFLCSCTSTDNKWEIFYRYRISEEGEGVLLISLLILFYNIR